MVSTARSDPLSPGVAIGLVYGRFAVGVWLLGLADVEHRWLALGVGLLLGAVLSPIPIVGWLANAVVFLLGFGALASRLYDHRRRRRETRRAGTAETTLE